MCAVVRACAAGYWLAGSPATRPRQIAHDERRVTCRRTLLSAGGREWRKILLKRAPVQPHGVRILAHDSAVSTVIFGGGAGGGCAGTGVTASADDSDAAAVGVGEPPPTSTPDVLPTVIRSDRKRRSK